MPLKPCVLAIDQGTTSSRSMLFDEGGNPIASAQREFKQHYPAAGWVEHSPHDIVNTVVETAREMLAHADENGYRVAAIGVTNQRETTIVWDRKTGEPIYNAIVWQDRRTADRCAQLRDSGAQSDVVERTGLLVDPYFSASKISWILDNVSGARARAKRGELAFGTVDSYLIYHLTGGAKRVTDATNASRTSVFNITRQTWDDELLRLFDVPGLLLPDVLDCIDDFGMASSKVLGEAIPIFGVAGDQQAAAIGQGCFEVGDVKSTYGTGCFVLSNTGTKKLTSKNKMLSTIAYRLSGKTTYALEGSIFIAGAGVQWLRDELQLVERASETEALARGLENNGGVYLVPAFTGLGAPHWDPDARGAIFGLTRGSGKAHIARATLESVCYQTNDLLDAMQDDGVPMRSLKIDGGMVANNWLAQFLTDIVNLPITRAKVAETTALGAARLAGYKAGVYDTIAAPESNVEASNRFDPAMHADLRRDLLAGWQNAVERTLTSK
ncbi:MAG: glycerol kinase GlpK [Pseudomonadota bacterium]